MPSFLANTLPQICSTLLALDISANFLVAIPPALTSCTCLEELNIASNPLRVLPVFLSHLNSLRVLIADSTGISTLPESFSELDKLHTLSVRRNKMNALPSWLCLLFSLQTLYVDGNPFQGPWKALVEPLLAKVPMTPAYPLSTPVWPLPSASIPGSSAGTEADMDDLSDPPTSDRDGVFTMLPEEEDTITPERAPFLGHAVTAPNSAAIVDSQPARRGLIRTRTAPNRAAYDKSRADNETSTIDSKGSLSTQQSTMNPMEDSGYFGDHHEVRKMKSAGELRGNFTPLEPQLSDAISRTPPLGFVARPSLTHYATSASSSNLLNVQRPEAESLVVPQRFASLGVASLSPSKNASGSRPAITRSLWDNTSEADDDGTTSPESNRTSSVRGPNTPPAKNFLRDQRQSTAEQSSTDRHSTLRSKDGKDGKDKGRWGFFRKMSMGKMRTDSPSSGRATPVNMNRPPPDGPTPMFGGAIIPELPALPGASPRIDVRFSTTGTLGAVPPLPAVALSPPITEENFLNGAPKPTPNPFSGNSLAPPSSPTPRSMKRRSFLPIDTSQPLNIPTPSAFVLGVTASNADEPDDATRATPSPVPDPAELSRREEEKLREASTRALRSVMAYLKDMNDLNQTQTNVLSMYGSTAEEAVGASRSRRPTIVDTGRGVSENTIGSVSESSSSGQLRSMESMAKLRNGGTAKTLSVATTDSSGSGSSEERKYKDDKSKRSMVVREIVEYVFFRVIFYHDAHISFFYRTERTYVKSLEELVDLYIKPSAAPVNMLSGVGSNKDTVVPAAERKIVFNGLDALFSFHKESFLPALEIAAAPVMKPTAALKEADADGQLSLNVVKAVAGMFIKHAAFMRMYSSYIKYVLSLAFFFGHTDDPLATLKTLYSVSDTGRLIVSPPEMQARHPHYHLHQVQPNLLDLD